jgi:hypothetical protein
MGTDVTNKTLTKSHYLVKILVRVIKGLGHRLPIVIPKIYVQSDVKFQVKFNLQYFRRLMLSDFFSNFQNNLRLSEI